MINISMLINMIMSPLTSFQNHDPYLVTPDVAIRSHSPDARAFSAAKAHSRCSGFWMPPMLLTDLAQGHS